MADPLAALDPQGKATVISYDVPEPTSYSGRNFLQIPLPSEAFTTIMTTPGEAAEAAGSTGSGLDPDGAAAVLPPSGAAKLVTGAVVAPEPVVVAGGPPEACPVVASPLPLSDRLKVLTNADVASFAATGRQVAVYRDISGQLDYQTLMARDTDTDTGGGGGYEPIIPTVWTVIRTPAANAELHGSAAGVTVSVSGDYGAENLGGPPTVTVSVDGGPGIPATLDPIAATWSASVTISSGGGHTIRSRITGTGRSSVLDKSVTVSDTADVTVTAVLEADGPTPVVLPTAVISHPANNAVLVTDAPVTSLTVRGSASCGPSRSIASVTVTDSRSGIPVAAGKVGEDFATWSIDLPISELGTHTLTVVATDDAGNTSPAQQVSIKVTSEQPFRRMKSRLLIVETLNLSSFLGSFGAGRVIKTFSLLPGEKTTISVKSWKKSADSSKSGSSIVDSDATEAASDFEDTLRSEQSSKEAHTETSNYKIGASAGASWGWGNASITAEVSGSANASREEAVNNLATATRKHSMKASANRSVTINTEYTATHEEGSEDSTTREIANVNVSRTLNFVFRQMNQQHITLVHLTNVRIGFYTEDLMLDAQGNPEYVTDPVTRTPVLHIRRNYTEVPLPELRSLLNKALTTGWRQKAHDAIINALTGIPDYQDELRTVVEYVTPTKDGQEVAGAEYLRFPRNLKTDFTDPVSGQVITVPGIVLAYDHIVMRTDGVMVDSVLGQGNGLDGYSEGLQQVAIAERNVALAERNAELERQALARQLVVAKDKEGAEIFARVFPAPPAEAPMIRLVETTPSQDGKSQPLPSGNGRR